MTIFIIVVHVIVAVFLILTVLLQAGKGADLAGAFGGAGSETAFGSRGTATLLSKLTTASAVIFMLSSLGLSVMSLQSRSLIKDEPEEVQAPAAEAPVPDAEAPAGAAAGSDDLDQPLEAEQGAEEGLTEETDQTAEEQPADTNES
jgi:preprotein translocase subunit SecG